MWLSRMAIRGRSRTAGRAGFTRIALILLSLAVLLAHAATLAHLLVVEHGLCEHGQLIEGASHTLEQRASERAPANAWVPGHARESGHHHCDTGSIPYRLEGARAPITGAPVLISECVLRDVPAEHRALVPLMIAPKTSPPVSARAV